MKHHLRESLHWMSCLLVLAACPMDDDEDDDGADEAAQEESTTDEPTTGDATTGDPTTDDPTTGDPTTGDPTTNDPTTGDPATDDGESSDGGSTGEPTGSVEGIVRRTSELAPDGDGIGTLYLGAFVECDHAAPIVGFVAVPNADLSQLENEVPFVIENLTVETVYLASFLDDNLDADQAMPLPNAGDPVLADDVDDGLLTCIEVQVANGSGVVVELNMLEMDE